MSLKKTKTRKPAKNKAVEEFRKFYVKDPLKAFKLLAESIAKAQDDVSMMLYVFHEFEDVCSELLEEAIRADAVAEHARLPVRVVQEDDVAF